MCIRDSDEAVAERVTFLREGAVAEKNLLVVQEDVGDGDGRAVHLAERRDTIVVGARQEVLVVVVLLFGGRSVTFVLGRDRELELELFVRLVAHDVIVVDRAGDLSAIGKL